MIVTNIQMDNLTALKTGFKQFLNTKYNYLSHKDIICSEAFYIFRQSLGLEPKDILLSEGGIATYKEKLIEHFTERGRKNPKSDSNTYCHAIKLLKEYVTGDEISISEQTLESPKMTRTVRKTTARKDIPVPTETEVLKYLGLWETLENYKFQEDALNKLFFATYPHNTLMEDVLVKVSTLNDFYSTNIYAAYKVAKHIIALNIDKRLECGDASLVNDIAKVEMGKGKIINFYSFATKYCSHHKPLDFPIYDSFVDELLKYFRGIDSFCEFRNEDLKNYASFKNILIKFRRHYGLEKFNLKEIDKYLWQLGKDKFPRNYSKNKTSELS